MGKVRWHKVLLAIAVGLPALLAGTVLSVQAVHQYRVWRAGGEWCVVFSPDGSARRLYGEDCRP